MMLVAAVLATWVLLGVVLVALGSSLAALAPRSLGPWGSVRVALWLGLALLVLLLAVMNLFVPLRSGLIVGMSLAASVGSVLLWWFLSRRRAGERPHALAARPQWWVLVPIAALSLALIMLAHAFAGPIDNWDAGLYQLNAIQYAAEYPVIPGLANFHERLGTNMTSSLLAAFLTSSPWGIDAFRLLVGFFAFLFAADLTLRLVDPRQHRRPSPGLIVMLLGALAGIPFLIASPGTWVTSPTPDSISMLIAIVAGAYLADALWYRSTVWSVVAVLVGVIAATVRTQLWVFTVVIVVVLVLHQLRSWRSRGRLRAHRALLTGGVVIAGALVVVMMVRDVLLSGWLLFPASVFPMPVEWRVPDPEASRVWILSWARDPGSSPEEVLDSWTWLWPWVGRSVSDWAVQAAIGLLAAAGVVFWFTRGERLRHRLPHRLGWRGWLLALSPVLLALGVWFWTAPDPRFAWGPLVLLGALPATAALLLLGQRTAPGLVAAVAAAFMTLAIAGPALSEALQVRGFVEEGFEIRSYDFGPVTVTAAVNDVTVPETAEFLLDGGQTIITPTQDDRCYLAFPLCRPYPDATLKFRGDTVQDGFISGQTADTP